MSTKTIFFDNDYSLIDGNRVVKNHRTELVLGEFAVGQLEKIKVLSMHIALAEEQADALLDCLVNEFLSCGGDIQRLEAGLEDIGHFLDYYLTRLPRSVKITDEDTVPDDTISDTEESIHNLEESIPNLELMEEQLF